MVERNPKQARFCNLRVNKDEEDDDDYSLAEQEKASASRAEDPVFESHLRRHFSGPSHSSDLKNGIL